MVLAVPALDVGDDLVAATFVKVNVEVGHRILSIQETLEDEAVLQRVEFGDLHGT